MMRYKGWLLTLGMMMAVLLVTAQPHRVQGLSDNQRLLGYVETDSITISGVAFGQAGTFPVGAILDANDLAPYAGCRVVGIRMAASMDLGRARTFIYTITETDVTPVIEQKQHIYPGWNNVFFNGDGYLITGNEYLFFGFDYTETAEMVAAEEGGLCCYGEDTEGAFYTYADFGKGLNFYSLGDVGCLCVQLIVDVSSLPKKDLDVTSVTRYGTRSD